MSTYPRFKLVIVGDGAVGKTCLLMTFHRGDFPHEPFLPTVFEDYVTEVQVEQLKIELALFDTAGQEEYERLRPLAYAGSHVILIAYSIDCPDSLENVEYKWIPELQHFIPKHPIILVGCKKDTRNDAKVLKNLEGLGQQIISTEEGKAVASKIGARHFFECSATTKEGVTEIFEASARTAMAMEDDRIKKIGWWSRRRARGSCVVF
ncbi:P-loop containing nucleoside triphosphate hydrolase protein [Flagelloscypha sp. PMI_526]|nr:P-loop containing nucleoside triphosphate hydrolase protein [Flagelloscypha sp. PMI_526]